MAHLKKIPSYFTFAMIKPDAIERNHLGSILERIIQEGFFIVGLKMLKLSKEQASCFYDIHQKKSFFNALIEFISSNYVVVMVLKKQENVISDFRKLIGATDPKKAAEGTIRKLYAYSLEKNAIHGSDSEENALKEIDFFFSKDKGDFFI